MAADHFTAAMTINRVLELREGAVGSGGVSLRKLCAFHLSGETLAEAAASYGVAIEKLLADLNALFVERPRNVEALHSSSR